jgi:ATP-dependent RNA helicase RhlB
MQIHKDAEGLGKHSGLRSVAIFGGMDFEKQRRELRGQHIDLVVATPGRLLDFKRKGDLHLNHVEVLIIDEGDRMLDMGFIPDVRSIIVSTPPKTHRQTLLFSATLTDDVRRLASSWTRDPITIDIEPEQVAVDTVNQIVYIVTLQQKWALFYNILQRENPERVMVFGNRRDEVERLCDRLKRMGINCALLSGAVPQQKRMRVLEDFREGKIRVLVATDVAGRGLHVEGVSHVVNYNLPLDPEDYVHRIGRTGRAGASGISISFADEDDAFHVPDIEKFIGRPLPCTTPDDEWLVPPPEPAGGYGHGGHRELQRGPRPHGHGPRRGGPRRSGGRRPPHR